MSQTETVKINFQGYNANTAVGIATECLICGDLICTDSIYEHPAKICDKCKAAVIRMREQMENEEKEEEKKQLKKLFISCPMKGRTEENIKKSMEQMHKIAEIIFDQELEAIPTFIEDNPPEGANAGVWYLGESIKLMAEADYFIGIDYQPYFRGCEIETSVANAYDIPRTRVNMAELMPDCVDIIRAAYNDEVIYPKNVL